MKDGWNYPGDAFMQDEDGYFFYQARADDMIITSGYNVGGPEVEDALLRHPAVAECGVIGKPDEERGMIVKAFCVLKPGHAGDAAMVKALQDHVKASIAPFKYPREIEFVASLPRTETGKLQRFKLRQASEEVLRHGLAWPARRQGSRRSPRRGQAAIIPPCPPIHSKPWTPRARPARA